MSGMRTAVALLLILTPLGCAFSPRVVQQGPGRHAAVNERATRQDARLLLRDGTSVRVRGLTLGDQTATWNDPETGAPGSANLAGIAEVRFKNTTGRAARIGGGWGFVSGAVVGVLAGFAAGSDSGPECSGFLNFCMTAERKALVNAILLAPLGWLIGLPIGASTEVDDIYRLPTAP